MCVCKYTDVQSVVPCMWRRRHTRRKLLTDTDREDVQAVFLTVSVTVCHNKPTEAASLCLPLTEYYICRWLKEFCLTGRQRKMDSVLTRNRKHRGKHPYQKQ